MNHKILLVEDDPNLGFMLCEYLNARGYETSLANDGDKGLNMFMENQYDFCILDVMMPKKDGFALAKEIKTKSPNVPIMFLTAKSMTDDTIKGLSLGADDYMTKPFSMEELLLRIKAIMKRVIPDQKPDIVEKYTLGNLQFFPLNQALHDHEQVFKLTTKEADLLSLFCQNINKTVSRSYALKLIWGDDSYFNARSMDVYITKLRKFLKSDPSIQILNLHGEGFKLINTNS